MMGAGIMDASQIGKDTRLSGASTPDPVSYTHLDVYKRQYDYKVVSIYEYLEKRFGLLTRRTASMAVSYTHLDVYKRQAL